MDKLLMQMAEEKHGPLNVMSPDEYIHDSSQPDLLQTEEFSRVTTAQKYFLKRMIWNVSAEFAWENNTKISLIKGLGMIPLNTLLQNGIPVKETHVRTDGQ